MAIQLIRPRSPGGDARIVIARPAELVELSERVYRSIFGAGLYLTALIALYSVALAFVQVGEIDRLRAVAICAALALGLLAGARRSTGVYRRLRSRPALWVPPLGLILMSAHVAIGPGNQVLFPPTLTLLGVLGAVLPMRWVLAAGSLAAVGQASPVLLHELSGNASQALLTAAAADLFIPLLFTALIARLARFMLELHRTMTALEATPAPPIRVKARVWTRTPSRTSSSADEGVSAGTASPLPITPRQMQVLALAAEGITHAEIGSCLGISEGQVTRLLAHARRRVDVITTQQLVTWAISNGLLPPPQPSGS